MHRLTRQAFACLLPLAVSALPAAAAELAPGPYLGLSLGGSFHDADLRLSSGETLSFDDEGAAYAASAGMLVPLGRGAFGIEGNVTLEGAEQGFDVMVQQQDGSVSEARVALVYDFGYGVSLLYGGFVGKALIYARGGYQWLRVVERVADDSGSRSAATTLDGPRAGVGVAYPLAGDRLALRIDYHHSFYRQEGGFDVDQDQVTVGLTLRF